MTHNLTALPANEKPLMANVIVTSIMAMESYLLSQSDCYKVSQLMNMTIGELWQRHSELVQQMDGLL